MRRIFMREELMEGHNAIRHETQKEAFALVTLLKTCTRIKDIQKGRKLHADILKKRLLEKNPYLASSLINMYAKCEMLEQAHVVLEELPVRDIFSWSALISGYVQHGLCQEALNCFDQMQSEGLSPNAIIFTSILKACGDTGTICKGEQIHEEIMSGGLIQNDVLVGTALIDMYAKCGMLSKAYQVLDDLPIRNVVSWSALISGYAMQGQCTEAFDCFRRMKKEGVPPDAVTYTSILKACGSVGAIEKGILIHVEIVNRGLLEKNVLLGTALVDMYAKCGEVGKAREVLGKLFLRDLVSWSALISGYAQKGLTQDAFTCLDRMRTEGLFPNSVTFIGILNACGRTGTINKGKAIHVEILSRGLLVIDAMLVNSLVDMYAKCGDFAEAKQLSVKQLSAENIVSWNAIITNYVRRCQYQEAVNCYEQMQSNGLSANMVTFICMLKACGMEGAVDKGACIHGNIVRSGWLEKDIVLGTALVDMYAKCGEVIKAHKILDELIVRDVVVWSALIAGYSKQGQCHNAIQCFEGMQNEGFHPNLVTFTCILKVCGNTGALGKGKEIHELIVNMDLLKDNTALGNALVDMYAKCGDLAKAQEVFNELPSRDVVSWNALMSGYAQNGQVHIVLKYFEDLQRDGISPDEVTLLCVLNACSHSGLTYEAQRHFGNMTRKYGIIPRLEHHNCMAVISGCIGDFDKAISVIQAMPSNNRGTWVALLGACRKWGNVKLGMLAFDQAIQLDGSCAAAYVALANIFAGGGMQQDVKQVEAWD